MTKNERKLQRYLKLLQKYEEKVQKIAQKFTEEVCKTIGAEQIYCIDSYIKKLYTQIEYDGIKYQSGSHDLYFYNGSSPTLREYLEHQIELEKKK